VTDEQAWEGRRCWTRRHLAAFVTRCSERSNASRQTLTSALTVRPFAVMWITLSLLLLAGVASAIHTTLPTRDLPQERLPWFRRNTSSWTAWQFLTYGVSLGCDIFAMLELGHHWRDGPAFTVAMIVLLGPIIMITGVHNQRIRHHEHDTAV
jgi:hypothetical protein